MMSNNIKKKKEKPFIYILMSLLSFLTDLGPGQWETKTLPDWTHQHCARCGGQQSKPLPVLLRRGQAGQVLGSGVQQGKS